MIELMERTVAKADFAIPTPYLIFLGHSAESSFAKTAFGLRDWAPEKCTGEYSLSGDFSLGLPVLNPTEAVKLGAKSMVIGVANIGGVLRESWIPALEEALEAGLDVVSGLHGRLSDNPRLRELAQRLGRRLIDVRTPPTGLTIATGRKRTGNRLLTVGTDCALGKKYTALNLTAAFKRRGIDADFRATGQTGILIAGHGIPIDAVVSDFVAGAAEMLSPDAPEKHWDVVEGQGSLFHPAYAGVSLGLLHGTQPDVIVMCHEVGRDRILGLEDFATPSLPEAIELTLTLARRTNPSTRCAGVSINTSKMSVADAQAIEATLTKQLGIPVADPMRDGGAFEALVDACLTQ